MEPNASQGPLHASQTSLNLMELCPIYFGPHPGVFQPATGKGEAIITK